MRLLSVIFLILIAAVPLNADTELQRQTEHAQNYLIWTFDRIAHAWGKMKFHFHEGNSRLKDSAKIDKGTIQKHLDKVRIK